VDVDAAPGPSSVTTALMLSGFFAQRFVFLGFLPRRAGDILKELRRFSDATETLVLFESPLRADKTLGLLFDALGPRRYAICREMTKAHQQVYRDRLPSVPDEVRVPRKGEWTLVVEGKRRQKTA
jgi:16S rRNA (cytidine1402-2'-O)-methyltransferase